ncbi:mitochondrial 54S ribosomal protein [Maudiozyma humilis]|uniref:Mitochondrial 54S ribosomal protein n=1 Tax=Maudiozyma humilis TaxID=51915 RepID=A0AAV5RVV6_MAUHU|nr:mitochondrial 54S ribosomal protein [Kazachstania humilis]
MRSFTLRPLSCGFRQAQRMLSTTAKAAAEETVVSAPIATPAKTLTKDQLKKRELRKFLKSKAAARKPASEHPLYKTIPEALRYLRAAEVGQPSSQQTISLTTLVVGEKGVPPLFGNVSFPTPLRQSKVAVFSSDAELLKKLNEQFHLHVSGGMDLIASIKAGEVKVDFDKAFSTPELASALNSQLGRVLGPRGVLPSVKKGTVGANLESLIQENLGSMPFRERNKCISIGVAKTTFSDEEVVANIIAARAAFKGSVATQKAKKQSMLSKTTISSSHGPGMVIDFA